MRAPPYAILTALLLALPFASSCSVGGEPKPRGVLLISIDSLRPDHLSCYGYESETRPEQRTSPVLDDQIAAEGWLFEQAFSTTSWTLPSHMALLTGMPNELHGVRNVGFVLPEDRTLLAEAMQRAGWRTGGFFSGPNLDPHFGFGRGFETYVDCSTAPVEDAAVFANPNDPNNLQKIKVNQRDSHQGVTSPKLLEEFESWFGGVGDDERFFAFVHMWDVHFDYAAPEEFDVFDPDYTGTVDGNNFWDLDRQDERDPRDVQHVKALYDAEILYTDDHIGKMLAALRARGRLDDTVVIVVSDHGEEFWEHGRFGHYATLFEEVVRVPILMRYPPLFEAGKRINNIVSLVDVAPTILQLTDVARPAVMYGRSLVGALEDDWKERGAPMEMTLRKPTNFVRGYRGRGFKALNLKAVQHSLGEGQPPVQFYDLENDPGEQQWLRPGQGVAMDDPRLEAARAYWKAMKMTLGQAGELGAELIEQLNQMGYADAIPVEESEESEQDD